MAKKIFLALFAIFILILVINLVIWDRGKTASQEAITQRATRLDYIEDQSPSLIAFDPQGRIWVYGSEDVLNKNGSLVVYDNGEEIARYTEEDSPVLSWLPWLTSEITFDNDGTVWIGRGGEDGGLTTFDGSAWKTFDVSSGLPTNWVTTVEVDRQGRLWAGFYEHGLGIYEKGKWVHFTAENSGLSVNTVHDIAFDEQGRAWLTTDRGGLNIFDGEQWQILNAENSGLAHDATNTILFDNQGRAWIDTWTDISVYDEERGSWLHYPVEHDPFSSMFFDAAGRLWVNRGMDAHVFDGKTWEYYYDPNSSLTPKLPDPQGNILMANGYDTICIVAVEDVNFNLQSASEGRQRVFVESGGIFVLAAILILMWLAAFFDAWWTMAITAIIGIPAYSIYSMLFGGNTPASADFFSSAYVWNPGAFLGLCILISGMLGKWIRRRGLKGAEWIGIILGLVIGILFTCVLGIVWFIFTAK